MKRASLLILITTLILTTGGCGSNKQTEEENSEIIELTYYRLFDDEAIFTPLIQEYETLHPEIKINYQKFTDPGKTMELIINEMAEGEGPDMFSMENSAFLQHRKKLTPAPLEILSPEIFKSEFTPVAVQEMIMEETAGNERVYGIPLFTDSLALYYNKAALEEALPSKAKPGATWEEIQQDVIKLNRPDNSLERFERSGIALGRGDNILRATDILLLLFLQHQVPFYTPARDEVIFAEGANTAAEEALALYASFALPSSPHYSWNTTLADVKNSTQEVTAFARGKTAMIFGYSYLYNQIEGELKELQAAGKTEVTLDDIGIAPAPQLNPQSPINYANYFAETVARTSTHPKEAWEFLNFLAQKENMEHYHEQTHRPSARKDLLAEQALDEIYGTFAQQMETAQVIPMPNMNEVKRILIQGIHAILETHPLHETLLKMQGEINALL